MGFYENYGLFCVGKPKGLKWYEGFHRGKIILSEGSLSFSRDKKSPHDDKFELPLHEIAEIETNTRRLFKYLEIHTTSGSIYSLWPLNWTGNPSGKKTKELEELLKNNIKALKISMIEKFEETKKEILGKMSQFLRVSDRLNLHMMRNTLQMEQSDFNDKIFDWCEKFDFSIEGDTLIINNKGKIPDFIDYLKNKLFIFP